MGRRSIQAAKTTRMRRRKLIWHGLDEDHWAFLPSMLSPIGFMHNIMHTMPRIARPSHPQLPRLRRELAAYLERTGSNPNSYARQMGVSQSTVQRFLSGRTKNITEAIRPLLIYAGISFDSGIDEGQAFSASPGSMRIRRALEKVWDGGDASAVAIAQVIEAIGPFLSSGRRRSSKQQASH